MVFGLLLLFIPGVVDWGQIWPWTKAAGVLAMSGYHGWLAKQRKAFVAGTNTLTGGQYRLINEVPTILLLVIVISVSVKF